MSQQHSINPPEDPYAAELKARNPILLPMDACLPVAARCCM